MTTANHECLEALRRLDAGDLADWAGLPYGCGHAALRATFEAGGDVGHGLLSGAPMRFRMYRAPHQAELLQAWFDDRDNVVLITLRRPTLRGSLWALLDHLGPPDKKLGPEVGYHADAHQWIYAGRGLTLYVREHVPDVVRVAVFQPSVPDYYEQYLGARDQTHYWPQSRRDR